VTPNIEFLKSALHAKLGCLTAGLFLCFDPDIGSKPQKGHMGFVTNPDAQFLCTFFVHAICAQLRQLFAIRLNKR